VAKWARHARQPKAQPQHDLGTISIVPESVCAMVGLNLGSDLTM
jgi:hypothetical protein